MRILVLFLRVPLALAALSIVLAIAGALAPVFPFGGERLVEREKWPILLVFLAPPALLVIGTWALYRWETQWSRAAQWSAWLISLLLLVGSIMDQGAGLFFWPAATVFLLATSTQQNRKPAIWIAWIVLLTLLVAAPLSMGLGAGTWLLAIAAPLALSIVVVLSNRERFRHPA